MSAPRELVRRLGFVDLTCIVMGAIIGVGIFFSPGKVARIGGSTEVALLAWIAGGVMGLAGALTFAELGGLMPKTGGQYHILRAAFGRPVAFLYGWSLLSTIQSGAVAIVSLIAVDHLASFFGVTLAAATQQRAASALIVCLVTANVLGISTSAWLANGIMALKILVLSIIGWAALAHGQATPALEAVHSAAPAWKNLMPALVPVLFAIGGWQQATYVAGEVKDPGRVLPLGIISGVILVVGLYLLVNWGALSVLGAPALAASKTPVADVVRAAMGARWADLVKLAVALSAVGVAHVCILTAPRMYKAMADDGSFFRGISRVHPRFGTPMVALLLQGGVSILLVIVAGADGVDKLLTGVVCIDCIFFAATGVALFVLRRKMADAPRPYRAHGYPVIPALFVAAELAALAGAFMDPETVKASIVAVIVLVTGIITYWNFRRTLGNPE